VRDARGAVDPDRYAGPCQRVDAAVALARCRPVGDEPDIDPALLGAEQRLDDA
jgi:hypothetical protein